MVIFCPIAQFGCFKASSNLTFSKNDLVFPLNGPPDAVKSILPILFGFSPFKDWKIALCSLSTGKIRTPHSLANGIIICPAVTSVSLFASAISFFALIASIVGRIPIIPTIAVTRISTSGSVEISINPSMPLTTFTSRSLTDSFNSEADFSSQTATAFGANSRICFSKSTILLPAANAATCKSLYSLTTSNVWVPIEPVDPNTAIVFIKNPLLFFLGVYLKYHCSNLPAPLARHFFKHTLILN